MLVIVATVVAAAVVALFAALAAALSLHRIGPNEVGLVTKRFARRKLAEGNPIAFRGEAGYQAELLMPGLRFRPWPRFSVRKFPWVQVPAGEIGVVIAQVGRPLPIGAKSARYQRGLGNFSDLNAFLANGGEKGVQRPVLPPGSLVPIHPVAFLVITARKARPSARCRPPSSLWRARSPKARSAWSRRSWWPAAVPALTGSRPP